MEREVWTKQELINLLLRMQFTASAQPQTNDPQQEAYTKGFLSALGAMALNLGFKPATQPEIRRNA